MSKFLIVVTVLSLIYLHSIRIPSEHKLYLLFLDWISYNYCIHFLHSLSIVTRSMSGWALFSLYFQTCSRSSFSLTSSIIVVTIVTSFYSGHFFYLVWLSLTVRVENSRLYLFSFHFIFLFSDLELGISIMLHIKSYGPQSQVTVT